MPNHSDLNWYYEQPYPRDGQLELPFLLRQEIELDDLCLIRFSDTVNNEMRYQDATVHFFENDDRFDEVWNLPARYLDRLGQYRKLMTPDFSLNWGAPLALQVLNTFRTRWCGWFWQRQGLAVIPTVSWSDPRSFLFCFDGIERGAIVAISTVGCRDREVRFMTGYNEMLNRIRPSSVICYGEPFPAMAADNLIVVPYSRTTRVAVRR